MPSIPLKGQRNTPKAREKFKKIRRSLLRLEKNSKTAGKTREEEGETRKKHSKGRRRLGETLEPLLDSLFKIGQKKSLRIKKGVYFIQSWVCFKLVTPRAWKSIVCKKLLVSNESTSVRLNSLLYDQPRFLHTV